MSFSILNWGLIAVSLANTVLLFWLGFTILINAERRSWGMWLIAGGQLTGGAFFVSHTAILSYGLTSFDTGLDFWWHLGLLAVITLPFVWYFATLWYTGFFEERESSLRRRQRYWLVVDILLMALLVLLLVFANPFPSYEQVVVFQLSDTPTIGGLPLLVAVYAVSTLVNVLLAMDALARPGPSRRLMGDVARRRARPWLLATSVMLLIVSVLVAGVMFWVIRSAEHVSSRGGSIESAISYLDLIISSAILVSVLLVGQSVVKYEVFTGKTLPQQRFMRHWRNAVILAAGYGAAMSATLELRIHPVYSVLLTALMLTLFYSLFSHNSYIERERYLQHLRPFMLSQKLFDQLVSGAVSVDALRPFQTLCDELLGTQCAYLIPSGPLAPLIGPGIAYPAGSGLPRLSQTDLSAYFSSPNTMCLAVEPARYGGASWAIPLWSERGPIGLLLLGEKRNGGLYTREEIEIARASAERLIDTQASIEIARRLMTLQRQRLTETQLVDRRTRRILHDDILPRIHTAMLDLGARQADNSNAIANLADIHRQIADLLHDMPSRVAPELAQAGLIGTLRQAVSIELGSAFDTVQWTVDPAAEEEAESIPLITAEVVYYAVREAIRNAGRHGRGANPSRPLHLAIEIACRNGLRIAVQDDGVGLEQAPSSDGSGNGLALHSTMMAVIGGSLEIESVPGQWARVCLSLPRQAALAGS